MQLCYYFCMIGSIRGKITHKTDKFLIIETGGVGYKINVSPETLTKAREGSEMALFIHTHVREDALDLYGFDTLKELEFFEMLINVSGIGPRSAVAILGVASMEVLRRAISTGDTAYLTKVSGIGKKTAERIVIDLRDKIASEDSEKAGSSLQGELDALEALKSLGYSQNEAREALKKSTAGADTNTKIREALKILGGR